MTGDLVQPAVSGVTSDPNSFEVKLIEFIRMGDELFKAAQASIVSLSEPTNPLFVSAGQILFGQDGLSCAAYFLSAAADSLLSLRLLTIRDDIETNKGISVEAGFTVHGTAGLIRQALECSAKAHWIMHAGTREEFSARGLAALWDNAKNAITYSNAISSSRLQELKVVKQELLEEANKAGMMTEVSGKLQPVVSFYDTASILRNFHFSTFNFTHLAPLLGSNFDSGEWMYSWLSGVAHGLMWCHPNPSEGLEDEKILGYVKPDLVRLTLCLIMAVEIIESTLDAFDREFPYQKSIHGQIL